MSQAGAKESIRTAAEDPERPLRAIARILESCAKESAHTGRWTPLARGWLAIFAVRNLIPAGEAMVIVETRQSSPDQGPAARAHRAISFEEDIAMVAWPSLARIGGLLDRDLDRIGESVPRWLAMWEDVRARAETHAEPIDELLAITELAATVLGTDAHEAVPPWDGIVRACTLTVPGPHDTSRATTATALDPHRLAWATIALEAARSDRNANLCSILEVALAGSGNDPGPEFVPRAERMVRATAATNPAFDRWAKARAGLVWEAEVEYRDYPWLPWHTGTILLESTQGNVAKAFLAASAATEELSLRLEAMDPENLDGAPDEIRLAWQRGETPPKDACAIAMTERRGGFGFEVLDARDLEAVQARRHRRGPRALLVQVSLVDEQAGASQELQSRIRHLLQCWGKVPPRVMLTVIDAPAEVSVGQVVDLSALLTPSPENNLAERVHRIRALAQRHAEAWTWASAFNRIGPLIEIMREMHVRHIEGTVLALSRSDARTETGITKLWSHWWETLAPTRDTRKTIRDEVTRIGPHNDRGRARARLLGVPARQGTRECRDRWTAFVDTLNDGIVVRRLAARAIRHGPETLSPQTVIDTLRRCGRKGRASAAFAASFLATVQRTEERIETQIRERVRGALELLGINPHAKLSAVRRTGPQTGVIDEKLERALRAEKPIRTQPQEGESANEAEQDRGSEEKPGYESDGPQRQSHTRAAATHTSATYARRVGQSEIGCHWTRAPWHARVDLNGVKWVREGDEATVAERVFDGEPEQQLRGGLRLLAGMHIGIESLCWTQEGPDEVRREAFLGLDGHEREAALEDLICSLARIGRDLADPMPVSEHARWAVAFEVGVRVAKTFTGSVGKLEQILRKGNPADLEIANSQFQAQRAALARTSGELGIVRRALAALKGKPTMPETLHEAGAMVVTYGTGLVWYDTNRPRRRDIERDMSVSDIVLSLLSSTGLETDAGAMARPDWDAHLARVDRSLDQAEQDAQRAYFIVERDLAQVAAQTKRMLEDKELVTEEMDAR